MSRPSLPFSSASCSQRKKMLSPLLAADHQQSTDVEDPHELHQVLQVDLVLQLVRLRQLLGSLEERVEV